MVPTFSAAELAVLQAERDNDPTGRLYAGQTDAQFHTNITTKDIPAVKSDVDGHALFDQTDPTEYAALLNGNTKAQRHANTWAAISNVIVHDLTDGSPLTESIEEIFGTNSQTGANIDAFRNILIARWQEMGIREPTLADCERTTGS